MALDLKSIQKFEVSVFRILAKSATQREIPIRRSPLFYYTQQKVSTIFEFLIYWGIHC